ncbi:MAG: GNAT family N-acetyltransferase [Candidatus Puniceispirillales bacterium]
MLEKKIENRFWFQKIKKNNLSLIFRKYKNYYLTQNFKKPFPTIEVGDFIIKLAEKRSEIKHAQSLRYSVFYKERNARASLSKKLFRRDYDQVDNFADHLIVIDKTRKNFNNKIIGTYRLMRGDLASQFGGFYTSAEFDLYNIVNLFKKNEILELGRSCVHQDYRNGTTMNLLWKAIANYVNMYDIKILLGCVSFPGTDVIKFSNQLSYLKQNHSLPKELSVESLDNNIYPTDNSENKNLSDIKTFVKLPPLIKGYLRVGGKVSESFFVDHEFNTIDLCVVVKTDNINDKYKKKFLH